MRAWSDVKEGDRVSHQFWPEVAGTVTTVYGSPNEHGFYQVAVQWDSVPSGVVGGALYPYRTADFATPQVHSIASLRCSFNSQEVAR